MTRIHDPRKANEIESWALQLELTSQVLPMDAACFREYSRLIHGRSDTLREDAMIAATARVHGLTIATAMNVTSRRFLCRSLIQFASSSYFFYLARTCVMHLGYVPVLLIAQSCAHARADSLVCFPILPPSCGFPPRTPNGPHEDMAESSSIPNGFLARASAAVRPRGSRH